MFSVFKTIFTKRYFFVTPYERGRERQQGFVLPYVLVAIAILSIVVTIAAQRLQNISSMVVRIQAETEVEIAFMNAEVETLYAYLVGVPMAGGLNLSLNKGVEGYFDGEKSDDFTIDLWEANGGVRRVDTEYGTVLVSYQDASGLIPINAGDLKLMEKLLVSLDVSSNKAIGLIAALKDYTDVDDLRQFRGGERADYRMRRLPPPTNSPLRSYSEFASILHWPDFLNTLDIHAFMDMTTLAPNHTTLKVRYTSPALLNIAGLSSELSQSAYLDDGIMGGIAGGIYPGNRARFTFEYCSGSHFCQKRVEEWTKKKGAKGAPFEKFWLYQTVVLEENESFKIEHIDEFKNVFFSTITDP